jgi:hypothetical protein
MEMAIAIQEAVWHQLAVDGRPRPVTGRETMAGDYRYDDATIRNFFYGVAIRLAGATPAFRFRSTEAPVQACLDSNVAALCGTIAAFTA